MQPKRIKVHPIGYIPIKKKNRADHYGESFFKTQLVHMKNGQLRTIKHYRVLALGGGRV